MPDLTDYVNLNYEGSIQAGGWTASLELTDPAEIVRFSALDAYATERWAAALAADAERLDFAGHVLPQSFRADFETSPLQVLAATSQVILQKLEVQALGWTQRAAPANNHQLVDLTLGAMARHILEEHCNVVYDAVANPNGWAALTWLDDAEGDSFGYFVTSRGTIWGIVQELANHGGFVAFFDKRDRLHFDYHPMFIPPPKTVTLDEELWYEITATPRDLDVNQVVATGRQDDGTDLRSAYPADKGLYGREESVAVRATTQLNLDTVAEYWYRYLTRPHDLEITTWATNLDLGDLVGVTYTNADLGIAWTDEDFIVEAMRIQPDLEWGRRVTTLRLAQKN